MLEMLETATILRHATRRSFVIMDEVGRGTTSLDGIAIAFACLHHLYYKNQCRTLFATHFHELAYMISSWPKAGNLCTGISENEVVPFLPVIITRQDGTFHFSHVVKEGINTKSQALWVAGLAGMSLWSNSLKQVCLLKRSKLLRKRLTTSKVMRSQ